MTCRAWRGLLVALGAAVLLAGPAQARGPDDLDTPLPPAAVLAAWSANGTVVAWLPAAFDGGSPVTAYRVYRLAGSLVAPTWDLVGQTAANATTILDDETGPGEQATYHVVAINAQGPSLDSPPSPPIMTSIAGSDPIVTYRFLICPLISSGSSTNPPFVAVVFHDECMPIQP